MNLHQNLNGVCFVALVALLPVRCLLPAQQQAAPHCIRPVSTRLTCDSEDFNPASFTLVPQKRDWVGMEVELDLVNKAHTPSEHGLVATTEVEKLGVMKKVKTPHGSEWRLEESDSQSKPKVTTEREP